MKRFPIDPEGIQFALPTLLLLIFTYAIGWGIVSWFLFILLIAFLAFFRDPRRPVPTTRGALVSPADGKIDTIYTNEDPEAGPVGGQVIGIFLSVLDVHVNRAPCAGEIERIHYLPGQFLDARHEDCAKRNEANWIFMKCGAYHITVRQIAGLIARRIICRVNPGQALRRGQRFGMIRFGSRTELYLPPEAQVLASIGERVVGGVTILAMLPETGSSPE